MKLGGEQIWSISEVPSEYFSEIECGKQLNS
jgi:hypothetical protein